jgi:NAD(P)-dependent dehydrogenase (short-subunit alcohol dehydrogenase family)
LIIPSDASEVAAQKAVAETLRQAFDGLDVLFLNAGVAELRPVEQWDERAFATNVKGPYFLIQALLPIFANPASVVLNASVNAHNWHAQYERLRSDKGCAPFACAHALW